ncbi:TIGR03745 family integrating conjugative element membrane protein [Halomonas sp. E19]|uniref:TIGR03745 family integrating conjugative element membrane protein n=1 Tax=Halomonas sp. E19 TaxID=3397247 RepID=UPI004034CB06
MPRRGSCRPRPWRRGCPPWRRRREEGEGLLTTLQNYLFDFGALGGLILATVAFLIVAIAAIATFNEARVRGEWSKFGVVVVVGVVLIIAIIWLATKASEIL